MADALSTSLRPGASSFHKKIFIILALFLAVQSAIAFVVYLQSLQADQRFGGDFVCFWQAGRHAQAGEFGAIYDAAGWRQALAGHARRVTWFVYPPFSLFGVRVLGGMNYDEAVAWWSLAPLPFYLALVLGLARRSDAVYRRVRGLPGEDLGWTAQLMVGALMLAFLTANALCGQTGAILAILLLAAVWFSPERPIVAGILIGMMAIKPQLGLLLPLALAAAGRWRTFAAAGMTVTALVLASIAFFRPGVWTDYLHLTQLFGHYVGDGRGQFTHLALGPYVSLLGFGAPIGVAALAQAVISLTVASTVVAVFRHRREPAPGSRPEGRGDLRMGMLAAGALLATPYALSYDTPLLALAVIPLFVRAWRRDCDGWELAAVGALAVTPYGQQLAGQHVPFGLLTLLFGFGVLARRYLRERPEPTLTTAAAGAPPGTAARAWAEG